MVGKKNHSFTSTGAIFYQREGGKGGKKREGRKKKKTRTVGHPVNP